MVAWEVLKSYGVNHTLIDILKDMNENAEAAVRIQNELGIGSEQVKAQDKVIHYLHSCSLGSWKELWMGLQAVPLESLYKE